MILQLEPPLAVVVVSKDNAKGFAYFILDYGMDTDVLWGVIMDDSGEVWWTPNYDLRFQSNWSLGRMRENASISFMAAYWKTSVHSAVAIWSW